MKKTLILLVFAFVAFAASAQGPLPTVKNALSVYGLTTDTCTNAETIYLYIQPVVSTTKNTLIAYLTTVTVSGTTAGKARLESSVDGSVWKVVGNMSFPAVLATDTTNYFTLANSTTSHIWRLSGTPAMKYRIYVKQSGTSVTKYSAKYMLKP